MEMKSVPKQISNLIKDNKTTRLGAIGKQNGRLTESPELNYFGTNFLLKLKMLHL